VQRELVTLSRGCLVSAKDELRRFRAAAPDAAPNQPAQPTPGIQPIPVQPSVIQPYSTEPLILDPITPAQ
jgi:hypothetical protein